jgi:hypothetical protein
MHLPELFSGREKIKANGIATAMQELMRMVN